MASDHAVQDRRLVLDRIVRLHELAMSETFAAATPDVIDAVLDGVAEFAEGEWAPLASIGDRMGPRWTADGVKMPQGYREAYRAFVDNGWGTIAVAQKWGGQGLPFVLQAAVLETLGAADMGLTLCPILTAGAIEALQHHGTPAQQAECLPRLATGEWTGTMNLTEPQAGSDVGALRSVATALDDGTFAIRGTKIFISFGDHDMADNIVHLVLARTANGPQGTRGISMFLVPKRRRDGTLNGVRAVSIEHKLGLHASPTCILSFGDEGDCIGELIGPEFGGMRAMFTMMNNARLNVGLQGVQVAEAATRKALAYARERVQGSRGGRPVAIIEHPDVRRMVLRMKSQTLAARALVYYACSQVDRAGLGEAGAQDRLEILTPLAKAHGTDLGNEVASLGIQVHRGMGYIEETGAARHFRDARITPIYEGTNGIHAADLVSRKLMLSEGEAFSALMADLRNEAVHPHLIDLILVCEATGLRLRHAQDDDRLAASYPFLTMLSVATCGWLLERLVQGEEADAATRAVVSFYLEQILPEAQGLINASQAPASTLYAIPANLL